VNTEITDKNVKAGQVLYDGACAFCVGWARRSGGMLRRAGFELAPLQSADAGGDLSEMVVRLPDGGRFGGADGIVQIARRIWWAWPLYALAKVPGVLGLLRAAYRQVAANRHCLGGMCMRPSGRRLGDGWPLLGLTAAALAMRDRLPGWVFMWALAWAIFFGCKWLMWQRATRGMNVNRWRGAGYMVGWVGMEPKPFLQDKPMSTRPTAKDWLLAVVKTALGIALVGLAIRLVPEVNALAAGWVGMLGIILSLHFGMFDLLARAWQRAGVAVEPLMRAPLLATSLGDFWGRRWNTGFHTLAQQWVFRPLARRYGMAWATMGAFFVSGLIHDAVISLSARGGYGLPTAYFVLQGAGVLCERSAAGRALGVGRGGRGRVFAWVVAGGPAFWLFHPIFVRQIILPMLQAIGAI
jgi:predicted DCC family thiol-disulfide oxidoreductase YuxK